MELSAYQLTWAAGGLGIAGTLVGVVCTYWLSLRMADRQFEHLKTISRIDSRNTAGREFVAAFAADLEVLESGSALKGDIVDFLCSAYADHQQAAIATFSHFVDVSKRPEFKEDWQRYCFGSDSDGRPMRIAAQGMKHDNVLFLHCYPSPSSDSAVDPRRYTAKLIRKLLTYAVAD